MAFEWDEARADGNARKHGVTFPEAATVFGDPLALTVPDPDHSDHQQREITFGYSGKRGVPWLSRIPSARDGRA